MRRLSIKTRVTLWYALLLILICALILGLMVASAERTAWDYCLETLKSASAIVMDETEYEHGELEIDADIDDVPNVYASLFEADGRLIYGRVWVDAPFEAGVMRRIDGAGSSWYIYDTLLTYSWRDDVYLRLHMNADMSLNAYTSMIRRGFWLFPLTAAPGASGRLSHHPPGLLSGAAHGRPGRLHRGRQRSEPAHRVFWPGRGRAVPSGHDPGRHAGPAGNLL